MLSVLSEDGEDVILRIFIFLIELGVRNCRSVVEKGEENGNRKCRVESCYD